MLDNKLTAFELKVIGDIKSNHGNNLQAIFEEKYLNGNHYDKVWVAKEVFLPICNKILTAPELLNLNWYMIEENKRNSSKAFINE